MTRPPTASVLEPADVAAWLDADVAWVMRANRWQSGRAAVGEGAGDELALDLDADDEEEQRHQQVIDPVVLAPRAIGPDQREDGGPRA